MRSKLIHISETKIVSRKKASERERERENGRENGRENNGRERMRERENKLNTHMVISLEFIKILVFVISSSKDLSYITLTEIKCVLN